MNYAPNKSTFLKVLLISATLFGTFSGLRSGRSQDIIFRDAGSMLAGAEQPALYYPLLEGKSIGLVCNHTSQVKGRHLVDVLQNAGFDLKVIFSPEHGFRGQAEAGAEILDNKDPQTGIRVISLYGKKKKPDPGDLRNIDLLIFDIQDVGVRFYTYISTLTLVMEAAAESSIPLVVLDRPNPNGFYIDGPVLDSSFSSFVGMHPVPVVYGMTIGEYAMMVNGEGWLNSDRCDLTVVPVEGYQHHMLVRLNVKPSPNLPTWESIYLYPSLCLFEGTFISVGRGTDRPFQVFGHPSYYPGSYLFIPHRIPGVAEKPLYEGRECLGADLTGYAHNYRHNAKSLNLSWLLEMHRYFSDSDVFFNNYFDKLAGTDRLRQDILQGKTEDDIREQWLPGLIRFNQTRSKYLLYP